MIFVNLLLFGMKEKGEIRRMYVLIDKNDSFAT